MAVSQVSTRAEYGNRDQLRGHVPLLSALLAALVFANCNTIVPVTLLPQIGQDLHSSGALLNWSVIITVVVGAVTTALGPRLARGLGERTLMLALTGSLVLGSVVAAVAPNMAVLLAGRAIAAVSLGVGSLGLSVVRSHFSGRSLTRALSGFPVGELAGGAAGLLLSGAVVQGLRVSWRPVFWFMAAFGAVCVVLAAIAFRDRRSREAFSVDGPGAGLVVAAVAMVLIPFSAGPQWGWSSPQFLTVLALGLLAAVSWFVVEQRRPDPFIDTTALRNGNFVRAWVVCVLAASSIWIINFSVPAIAGAPRATGFGFGYGPLLSGLVTVPLFLAAIVGSCVTMMFRWESPRVICAGGLAAQAVAFAGLIAGHDKAWQLWVFPMVFGFGYAFTSSAAYTILMQSLRPEQSATAASVGHLSGVFGSGLGGAAITAVLTSDVIRTATGAIPSEHSLVVGWCIGIGLAVAAATCARSVRLRVASGAPRPGDSA